MIQTTLQLLCARINTFLGENQPGESAWLVLSNLADASGPTYDSVRNKLVLSVANLQRETSVSTFARTVPLGDQFGVVTPALYINLYLVFYANFTETTTAAGSA